MNLGFLKNAGKDCWPGCKGKQGKCDWCGRKGYCCRKDWPAGDGCDGIFGGENQHICIRKPEGNSTIFNLKVYTDF